LQFKNKVKLGSKGLKAIVLQVANSLGIKGSITKRLSVVNNMYKNGAFKAISSTIEDITIIDSLKGDKWQAFVAILELNRVMELIKSGVAKETIESQLVVHQDGTCNGLQHISAFVKDRKTAGTVNLLASTEDDTPKDIYGLVVDNARKYVLDEHMHIVDALGRELGKKPVMVGGYGATIGTQKLEVLKTILEYLRETNTDIDRPDFLASAIVKGIEDTIPAISKFTNAIKAQALSFLQNKGEKIEWRTIDGFRVITEYRDIESKMVRTIEGGLSACISYDTNGDKISTPIDEVKTAGALSPNFVHSNDAAMVRETVIEVNKSIETDIVAIHDSIGCHAGNYERVSKAIRRSFVKLFTEYNMLESLAKCLDKEYNKEDENDYLKVIKFEGDFDIQETLNSTYLFS
jgi:DNA-directed RNA polymerase